MFDSTVTEQKSALLKMPTMGCGMVNKKFVVKKSTDRMLNSADILDYGAEQRWDQLLQDEYTSFCKQVYTNKESDSTRR